jgi:2-polyprenyl-3-methyl-5-hydroxy-6-metoxy-1,4-benzoquinol methylase
VTTITKSLEEVQEFWQIAAKAPVDADGLRPTARDPFLQEALETLIEARLDGGRLIDVGCGDGLSTLRFAPKVDSVLGVDFVQGFVDQARRNAAEQGKDVRFEQADVMDLAPVRERHGRFDAAVCIRVLINLATPENQARGLSEIAQCLEPGGLLFISEGWQEGMDGINRRRLALGLPDMGKAEYNILMPRAEFEAEAERHFTIEDYLPLGFYLFTSRVLMPSYVAPEAPRHTHDLNRLACEFQLRGAVTGEFADCDYAGIYVLRRK